MAEMIDIFTEQGEKLGTISKREYYSLTCADKDIPWINCASCFVIDNKNKKILFTKRGKRFLDPGKLDVVSGHIRSGEIPIQGMVRELAEEVSIDENDSRNLQFLGKVKVDYTTLEDETNRKRLKCDVSIYALKIDDINLIKIDHKEAISKGFLNYDDAVGFVENSMTRMPYEEKLKPQYDAIFEELRDYMFSKNRITEKARKEGNTRC